MITVVLWIYLLVAGIFAVYTYRTRNSPDVKGVADNIEDHLMVTTIVLSVLAGMLWPVVLPAAIRHLRG